MYVCSECEYSSKIKTHYGRHIKTKKHQKMIQIHDATIVCKSNPICKYCDANFASKHSARRHERKYCKKRPSIITLIIISSPKKHKKT